MGHRMEREREASCKYTWKSSHGLKNLLRMMEHLTYLPTSIHKNITGMASPLDGGPDRSQGMTKSGDSLFLTLLISPIERDGSFLTNKYPGSNFQTKVWQLLPNLLLLSIIGQATTNGMGSPWNHPLAFYSTGYSPCIIYFISEDLYQRGFQIKDAD